MPDRSVVSFDISVLLRLSGLDVVEGNALLLGPVYQGGTDVFRAIVDPYSQGLPAPLDDLIEGTNHPLSRQREVDLDAQAFAVEVIQHIQKPELAAIGQAISHEVHRPDGVRCLRDAEFIGFVAFDPPAGFDPQVQLQFAVDPVDTLMVPRVPLDIAHVQEA